MIGLLIMILLSASLIILSIFAILLFRNVAIVLLVIVSPIAFACAILPNTKKIFDKWWSMFKGMLILYPMIAILFGGCALGAKIIGNANLGIDPTAQALAVLGMSVIPLLATPALMKGALKSLDALGGGIGSKLGERSFGSAQKFASNHIKASGKNAWQNSSARHLGYQIKGKVGRKIADNKIVDSSFVKNHSFLGRPFRRVGNTWNAQALQQNRQRQNLLEGTAAIAAAKAETEKANDAWAKDLGDRGKITNDMAMEALGKGTFMGKRLDEGQKVALIKQGAFKSIKGVHDKLWVLEQNDGMDHHDDVDHNTAGSYAFRQALISGAKDAGVAGIGGGAIAGYSSKGETFDSQAFATKALSGDSKAMLATGDSAQYADIANGTDANQAAGSFTSATASLTNEEGKHYVDVINGNGVGDKALNDALTRSDQKSVQEHAKNGVNDETFKIKQQIDANKAAAENIKLAQQVHQQAVDKLTDLQNEYQLRQAQYERAVDQNASVDARIAAQNSVDDAKAAMDAHRTKYNL